MKSNYGKVRFFIERYNNEKMYTYVLYSASLSEFSLLMCFELNKKKIFNIFSGRTQDGRKSIISFLLNLDTKDNTLRELSLNGCDRLIIDEIIEICESYSSEDFQTQNDVILMQKHIESTLGLFTKINDVSLKNIDQIVSMIEDLKNRLPPLDNQQLCCGICDDIDNMRMLDYYNIHCTDDQPIYGFICATHPIARKVLELLKENELGVIYLDEDKFNKSTLIFITQRNNEYS